MTTVEIFLAHFTPAVQALALQVREVVRAAMPDADERVDSGDQVIRYAKGQKMSDTLVYISAHKDSVNLGFFYGTSLSDPTHLLRGTGKRMRHIKFKSGDTIDTPAVRALVAEAWTEGQKQA